jgi:hypothetical protein
MPRKLYRLAQRIRQPDLPLLARQFLFSELNPNLPIPSVDHLPEITGKIYMYNSARVVYYAPSDISGLRGMHREWIRSTRSWYGGRP